MARPRKGDLCRRRPAPRTGRGRDRAAGGCIVNADVARLEHEVLSPQFMAWLREADDLDHDECPICHPPVYESGLHETRRAYTRALDCPLCGQQIKEVAEVLVRREYERHLAKHYETEPQEATA